MKLIGVTGLTCKTSTVHTIDQALVDQGYKTFAFTTFQDFQNRKPVGEPRLIRTAPMPEDVTEHRERIDESDFVLMEVTPSFTHDDRLQRLFGPLDISVMTVYEGEPAAGYYYADREQYFHYKNMIFGSCLKRKGTAILQNNQDDPAVRQAYNYAERRGANIISLDPPFDHVVTANAVLRCLGLPETATKIAVPGRQEFVRDRMIIEKCNEEPAYKFCNEWVQSMYRGKDIVIVVGVSAHMPDEFICKKIEYILEFDGLKKAIVYIQHFDRKIKLPHNDMITLADTRIDAFNQGIELWKQGAVLLLTGNGDQLLEDITDRELVESILKET